MKDKRAAAGASMVMKRYSQRAGPGARPGSIVVPDGALAPTIRVTCFGPEELQEHDTCDFATIVQLIGQQPVTWIDVVGLGDADLIEKLGQLLGLHRLALEDVVNVPQRSKVEDYQQHVFLVAQLPGGTKDVSVQQISFFAGKNFVLSLRERPSDCFDTVQERMRIAGRPIRQSGADYLLYALLDAVIDAYYPELERLGESLDELDEQIEEGAAAQIIARVHAARHDVRLLRRIVWPLREAVDSLAKEHDWLIDQETSVYLRDCHDHTVQIIDMLENFREACSDLRDYYATEISNRMNDVMKVLTVIATIFIPLSFIAGVYGMNFDPEISAWNMPELKWVVGYPFALCLMAVVAFGQLMFFRWRGWLGRKGRPTKRGR